LPPEAAERLRDEQTRLAEYVGEIFLADLDEARDSVAGAFFARASSLTARTPSVTSGSLSDEGRRMLTSANG
jgi:hypothetical protein